MRRSWLCAGGLALVTVALLAEPVLAASEPEPAPPSVVRCTDRGPLVAREQDGRWTGTLGALRVEGSAERLSAREAVRGTEVWSGPLSAIGPTEPGAVDREGLAQVYARLGGMKAKGVQVKGKGVKGTVDEDGILRASWKGDSAAWALDLAGEKVFGGTVPPEAPLARLPRSARRDDPFAAAEASGPDALARVVAAHLRWIGLPLDCGLGGTDGFALGTWRHRIPLAEGRVLAWATADEALVRGPEGAAWYLVAPMGASAAASLAAELASLRGARVAWEDGVGALLVSTDPAQTLPGTPVTASPGLGALIPLLRVDPAALRPEPAGSRPADLASAALEAGVEMVRRLNSARRVAGLPLVDLDAGATWAAYGHAAWVDANPERPPDREVARTPLYLAQDPADRGGASELVRVRPGEAPPLSVEAWVRDPHSRALVLHPAARRVGAAATPGGARVLEVDLARSARWERRAYPPDGATDVPLLGAGDGRGYAITVWIPEPARSVQVARSALLDAEGRIVDVELVRPGEGHGGVNASDAVVHLVPLRPLRSRTTYTWELSYTADGKAAVASGRFRTAVDPAAAPATLDPLGAQVVALLNAKRVEQGVPTALTATVGATQAAKLVAASRRTDLVERFLTAGTSWSCAPAATWEAWLGRGRTGYDATIDPTGVGVRYTLAGSAAQRGELCLLLAVEPLAP